RRARGGTPRDRAEEARERHATQRSVPENEAVDRALRERLPRARMRPEDELPHAERGRARGAVARRGEEEELPLADAEARRARDPEQAIAETAARLDERHASADG